MTRTSSSSHPSTSSAPGPSTNSSSEFTPGAPRGNPEFTLNAEGDSEQTHFPNSFPTNSSEHLNLASQHTAVLTSAQQNTGNFDFVSVQTDSEDFVSAHSQEYGSAQSSEYESGSQLTDSYDYVTMGQPDPAQGFRFSSEQAEGRQYRNSVVDPDADPQPNADPQPDPDTERFL